MAHPGAERWLDRGGGLLLERVRHAAGRRTAVRRLASVNDVEIRSSQHFFGYVVGMVQRPTNLARESYRRAIDTVHSCETRTQNDYEHR